MPEIKSVVTKDYFTFCSIWNTVTYSWLLYYLTVKYAVILISVLLFLITALRSTEFVVLKPGNQFVILMGLRLNVWTKLVVTAGLRNVYISLYFHILECPMI